MLSFLLGMESGIALLPNSRNAKNVAGNVRRTPAPSNPINDSRNGATSSSRASKSHFFSSASKRKSVDENKEKSDDDGDCLPVSPNANQSKRARKLFPKSFETTIIATEKPTPEVYAEDSDDADEGN